MYYKEGSQRILRPTLFGQKELLKPNSLKQILWTYNESKLSRTHVNVSEMTAGAEATGQRGAPDVGRDRFANRAITRGQNVNWLHR